MSKTTETPAATETAAVPKAPAEHPCSRCPMRSTAENSTYGYCENCPSVLRQCKSCWQHKPMVGWGYGFVRQSGLISWLCPDCRVPAEPEVTETAPTFSCWLLDLGDDPAVRYGAAEGLTVAAVSFQFGGQRAIARLADQVRRTADGKIEVDLRDINMEARQAVGEAIHRAYNAQRHQGAMRVLRSLHIAWQDHLEDSVRRPDPQVKETPGEHSRRVNGEKWLDA